MHALLRELRPASVAVNHGGFRNHAHLHFKLGVPLERLFAVFPEAREKLRLFKALYKALKKEKIPNRITVANANEN